MPAAAFTVRTAAVLVTEPALFVMTTEYVAASPPVVAEIAFQGVAIDHDPILITVSRDSVAEVVTVGMMLGAEVGDDNGDAFEHPLELLRQGVDRIGDKRFELIELGLLGHR